MWKEGGEGGGGKIRLKLTSLISWSFSLAVWRWAILLRNEFYLIEGSVRKLWIVEG